jgi:hypothetical protein
MISKRVSTLIKLNIGHGLSGLFFSSVEEKLSLISEPGENDLALGNDYP